MLLGSALIPSKFNVHRHIVASPWTAKCLFWTETLNSQPPSGVERNLKNATLFQFVISNTELGLWRGGLGGGNRTIICDFINSDVQSSKVNMGLPVCKYPCVDFHFNWIMSILDCKASEARQQTEPAPNLNTREGLFRIAWKSACLMRLVSVCLIFLRNSVIKHLRRGLGIRSVLKQTKASKLCVMLKKRLFTLGLCVEWFVPRYFSRVCVRCLGPATSSKLHSCVLHNHCTVRLT